MRIRLELPLKLSEIGYAIAPIDSNIGEDCFIKYISTDSRDLIAGDLFFALRGENFDGADFSETAEKLGAYTVCEKFKRSTFSVKNSVQALCDLAKYYKKLLSVKATVAITGSVGKTTTKELTNQILSYKYKTHATYKNLNNEIGVPLTILSAQKETEILIIEAGMNHFGELDRISRCIEPDIAVITKIGTAHIGNFGSKKEIAHAKSEILSGMKMPYLLIPYDDEFLPKYPFSKTVAVDNSNADFCLNVLKTSRNITFDFKSKYNSVKNATVNTRLSHIPECLAFALAVTSSINMTNSELYSALRSLKFDDGSKIKKIGTLTLIDDTYNASLESVKSAFKTLSAFSDVRKSAVLGDILELGCENEKIHYEVGRLSALENLTNLYIFGKNADLIKKGAMENGMREDKIFINEDISSHEITAEQIMKNSKEETIIFKASRRLKLENIINILMNSKGVHENG